MNGDRDDFEDQALAAMLRRHADELTEPIDVEGALREVSHRARVRRRWRVAGSALAAAAAAAAVVVAAAVLVDDDRPTVRTPVAQPGPPPITAPPTGPTSTASAPPASASVATTSPASTAPSTTRPSQSTTASTTSDTAPASAPTPSDATSPTPSTSTFSSVGGSIVVAHSNGAITLAEDPSPSSGWSVRIDDNGPQRVRVRFERDGQRSEIRVDLRGDQLVPEVTEG